MSFKYTRTSLEKIEQLYKELSYKIRYEKGSFQSGYCIVKDARVVVVNKFFDIKSRINVLLDILSQIKIESELLSDKSKAVLDACGFNAPTEQAA